MCCPEAVPADFDPAPDLLQHRNLLLVGAHTDLGHALARCLAGHGATLLLPTRKERLLAPLYDDIVANDGPEPLLIAMDLDKAESAHFDALAEGLADAVTVIHGLVHVDLPAAPLSPLVNSSPETWQSCFHSIVHQPMLLLRGLLPLLQVTERAAAIFLTLPCGRSGAANWGPLGAALAARENLCNTLTREHPSIHCSTLDTGPVSSDLRRRFYPAEERAGLRAVDDPFVQNAFLHRLSVALD